MAKISYLGLSCAKSAAAARSRVSVLPTEHLGVDFAIDVAAAHHYGDALAANRVSLFEGGGDGSGAAALGEIVGVVVGGADGVGDFVIGDGDDARDVLPHDFERPWIGGA